jgi:outer membrane protein TolC
LTLFDVRTDTEFTCCEFTIYPSSNLPKLFHTRIPMNDKSLANVGRGVSVSLLALTLSACAVNPKQISPEVQAFTAGRDRTAATADVPPLTGQLTLAEAIARALKYNLDHRTRMMEQALAVGQLDLSRYDMWPKLTAAAGYNWRDSDRITRSKDSVTGKPSLANPYISSERIHHNEDLGLTWNVLDFGVSYLSAQQNADRVMVAAEHRRKAMHLLMQDVRTAYWRVVCADKIDKELRDSIRLGEQALADSRKIESEKLRDPLEALRYQRTILENLRILESIQRELAAARIELGALMNLAPGTQFQLAEPLENHLKPGRNELPMERMEELAVANNADLKEQFYNTRMSLAETKKSMLRMFPSLSFNYSHKRDSDNYLINSSWKEAGTQISWNIFNLFSIPSLQRYNEATKVLADQRRITTQMAVLAQVHLSRQQYDSAYLLYERADEIWRVDQRISEHTTNREATEVKSQLDKIANSTSAIVSLLRRYQALSQVYTASSKVESTLGIEPSIGNLQELQLAQLTKQIEASLSQNAWNATASKPAAADTIAAVAPNSILLSVPAPVSAPAPVPILVASPIVTPVAEPVPVAEQGAAVLVGKRFYLEKISLPARMPDLNWTTTTFKDANWVAASSEATTKVRAVIKLSVPNNGKREARITWQLTDTDGKNAGQAKYASKISKPATNEDWRAFKQGAVAALEKAALTTPAGAK